MALLGEEESLTVESGWVSADLAALQRLGSEEPWLYFWIAQWQVLKWPSAFSWSLLKNLLRSISSYSFLQTCPRVFSEGTYFS